LNYPARKLPIQTKKRFSGMWEHWIKSSTGLVAFQS